MCLYLVYIESLGLGLQWCISFDGIAVIFEGENNDKVCKRIDVKKYYLHTEVCLKCCIYAMY